MIERLLIIEEDIVCSNQLHEFFQESFDTEVCNNGLQGLVKAIDWKPRVVLINHSLKNVSSVEVCLQIREHVNAVIIIMGAPLDDKEVLTFFEGGADEVISTPFNYHVLRHKINVLATYLIGKKRIDQDEPSIQRYGSVIIDKASHKVFCNNKEIILTKKEFALLWLLIQKKEEIITKQEIMRVVWSYEHYEDDRMIDTHLNRVRKKLKQCESDVIIKTLWGIGYKILIENVG